MRKRLYNFADNGCQWRYSNWYCPECKAHGAAPHSEGCNGKWVEISPTARFPRKKASKKTWKKFYEKFVLQLDLKEKLKEFEEEEKLEKRRLGTGKKLRRKEFDKRRKIHLSL